MIYLEEMLLFNINSGFITIVESSLTTHAHKKTQKVQFQILRSLGLGSVAETVLIVCETIISYLCYSNLTCG